MASTDVLVRLEKKKLGPSEVEVAWFATDLTKLALLLLNHTTHHTHIDIHKTKSDEIIVSQYKQNLEKAYWSLTVGSPNVTNPIRLLFANSWHRCRQLLFNRKGSYDKNWPGTKVYNITERAPACPRSKCQSDYLRQHYSNESVVARVPVHFDDLQGENDQLEGEPADRGDRAAAQGREANLRLVGRGERQGLQGPGGD